MKTKPILLLFLIAAILPGCKKYAMYPQNVNCEAVVEGTTVTIKFTYDGQRLDTITPQVEISLQEFKNHYTKPESTFTAYANWDGHQYIVRVGGLETLTTYYYRLYLSNTVNGYIVVDNGYSFSSSYSLPTVRTESVTDIHSVDLYCTAIVTGNVIDGGNCELVDRGVCWSTKPNPTLSDNYISAGSLTGQFIAYLTELSFGTLYYARAYATNCSGTKYGEPIGFLTPIIWQDGVLPELFSISDDQQVYFSQGNLQYVALTDRWRFADSQYEYSGYDNEGISENYYGRIDLFGWGTSGQPHGAVCYQPWSTSKSFADYYAYGDYHNALSSESGLADWGCNNIVNGGGQSKNWRTLTNSEWNYLLKKRDTPSGVLYAYAIVNQVKGIILLPDNWSKSTYKLNNPNGDGGFESNVISDIDWRKTLEANGAVFLPAAGTREGNTFNGNGPEESPSTGCYWSSMQYSTTYAYGLRFSNNSSPLSGGVYRHIGASVRLVSPAQ